MTELPQELSDAQRTIVKKILNTSITENHRSITIDDSGDRRQIRIHGLEETTFETLPEDLEVTSMQFWNPDHEDDTKGCFEVEKNGINYSVYVK